MDIVELIIDGKSVYAPPGQSVLEAALGAGIYIPHICTHPDLSVLGGCKLCIVEIEGISGFVTSCNTPVSSGMTVTTESTALLEQRRITMELILAPHPEECENCPKYLHCELQSLKQYLNITRSRFRPRYNPFPVDNGNPLFLHDPTRCINCRRCVRACSEMRKNGALEPLKTVDGRPYVGTPQGTLIEAGCRFCGACAEVCPTGAIRDRDGLVSAEKPKKQALVPCSSACPLGIDAPEYIRRVRMGDYAGAVAIVCEKAPFPAVLSAVCTHKCEDVCRRSYIDEPVNICALKKLAVESVKGESYEPPFTPSITGKRVAIIGSGPSGLTCGYYLAGKGHEVTVFESLPYPGGLLRVGIPKFRLPLIVLERELYNILKSGLCIVTNTKVESAAPLLNQGFDAVVSAVGAGKSVKLPIPGSDLENVYASLAFLRAYALDNPMPTGKSVVILGGGSVAFDCAFVAKELGAESVTIVCLEARDNMTASKEDLIEAVRLAISIYNSHTFLSIQPSHGISVNVVCQRVKSFRFDNGKPLIEVEENSEESLHADIVIFAIGQIPELPDGCDIPGVFRTGDCFGHTTTVAEAIASGKDTARDVDLFLGGDGAVDLFPVSRETPEPNLEKIPGFAPQLRKDSCGSDESRRCLQCDLRLCIQNVPFWSDNTYQEVAIL